HTRFSRDWSSDVCSSDLLRGVGGRDGLSHDGGLLAVALAELAEVGLRRELDQIRARVGQRAELEDVELLADLGAQRVAEALEVQIRTAPGRAGLDRTFGG